MNSRILSLALILSASQLHTRSHSHQSSKFDNFFSSQPFNFARDMEELAADPRLPQSDFLVNQLIQYAENSWPNNNHTLFLNLAQNPGMVDSNKLIRLVLNHLSKSFMNQEKELIIALIHNPNMIECYELEHAVYSYVDRSFGRQQHMLMVELANNPYLGRSRRLFNQVTNYLNSYHANNSDKSEILRLLAANPSVYNNYTYSQTIYTHVHHQQDPDTVAALFAGAAVGVAAGTVLYNLFFDEPTTRTTTYTTTYRR